MPLESAVRCQFRAGDVVDNQYTIIKVLGEGSFGAVYLAEGISGQKYALKLLRLWEVPAEIRQPLISRFDMEFETGRIESPYLVHSISHGFVSGNPYIVMEFCPDGDLCTISSSEYIDYNKVGFCVLNGLSALHKCGKVHRDLKPENVLRKTDGNYALTDFGISGDRNKRMTERNILGKPKQIMGTYAYMPPEQSSPEKDATVLPTTDIFSFGVMMYQIITGGELPFGPLDSERDLVYYIKNIKEGRWNRDLLKQTREGLAWYSVIEGCLISDFKNRIQSVDEILSIAPKSSEQIGVAPLPPPPPDYQTAIKNGLLLKIMQGEEYGRIYYLDDIMDTKHKWVLSMGRMCSDVDNDIPIKEDNSSYVSRRHCTLELDFELGEWFIRDGQFVANRAMTTGWGQGTLSSWTNSTNGTFVNSSVVSPDGHLLKPGDIISVGDTKLRVEAY